MGVFDGIKDIITANFSEWIQVFDKKSNWTIEDFPYSIGVNDYVTYPHCWKCVSVNQCWFKNEDKKKPIEFDYSNYSFGQIALSSRGLYHPNCHDKKKSINVPKVNDIKLFGLEEKTQDFFDKKSDWYYSWGYNDKDKANFLKSFFELTKQEYRYGNYEQEKHTRYGFQINIFVTINGVNEKKNNEYIIKTCYIVFPNGKLRLITLVGGWK